MRVGWVDVWRRAAPGANPYAHPINGLHPVVDFNRMELLDVGDTGPVDLPQVMGEYVPRFIPGYHARDDVRPLHITQPEGVSFQLDGNELRWQKWSLRIGFNYREGLSCTRSDTPMAAGSGRSPTACRWPRWWCRTGTRAPSTTGGPRSTSASGASAS